ncbi:hypothetical protein [Amycolatopsis sp. NPDC059657]|uniref:hypothetical protein n=1 Tax=Amycolatopsis sp. NPDC059657 TaxID=3346899 RepID=UPI0036720562
MTIDTEAGESAGALDRFSGDVSIRHPPLADMFQKNNQCGGFRVLGSRRAGIAIG